MVMTIPAVIRILAMKSIEAPGESCQTNAYSLAMQYENVGVTRRYGTAADCTCVTSGPQIEATSSRIHLVNQETTTNVPAASDQVGRFGFFLLPPGSYQLEAGRAAFQSLFALT
jgi:hypothetical protein